MVLGFKAGGHPRFPVAIFQLESNTRVLEVTNLFYQVTFSVAGINRVNTNSKNSTQKGNHQAVWIKEGRKDMFYLTTQSTHFIDGYMASDIW